MKNIAGNVVENSCGTEYGVKDKSESYSCSGCIFDIDDKCLLPCSEVHSCLDMGVIYVKHEECTCGESHVVTLIKSDFVTVFKKDQIDELTNYLYELVYHKINFTHYIK